MPNILKNALAEIRETSKEITAKSEITFNDSRLDALIEALQINANPSDHPFVVDQRLSFSEKVALVLLYGVVNYCYTNPETRTEYQFEFDGRKYARSTGFNQALLHSGFNWLDFNALSELTFEQWREVLQLRPDNRLYDAKNRLVKLRTMAAYLKKVDVDNFFTTYNDTNKIFELLQDTGLYDDPFYKRAQITLSLLGRISALYGDEELASSAPLTVMADYRLPQVLYNFDVLTLPQTLSDRLVQGTTFIKNEPYERDLRAWTIVLGEKMAHNLGVSEEIIDARMWALSQDMIHDGRMKIPAMLVATDCY